MRALESEESGPAVRCEGLEGVVWNRCGVPRICRTEAIEGTIVVRGLQ